MHNRKITGFTLIEMLITVFVSAIVLVSVMALVLASARVYMTYSGLSKSGTQGMGFSKRTRDTSHPGSLSSEMLAFKRMESEIREAVRIESFDATSLEFRPVATVASTGGGPDIAQMVESRVNGQYIVRPAEAAYTVKYFLGSLNTAKTGAKPDPAGTMLFRFQSNNPKSGLYYLFAAGGSVVLTDNQTSDKLFIRNVEPPSNTVPAIFNYHDNGGNIRSAVSTASPLIITVNGNRNITANFVADASPASGYRVLTVNALNGNVTKSPDQGTYYYGTVVTLTAVPITGYHFVCWYGDISATTRPTDNPITVTMHTAKTIYAVFELNNSPSADNYPCSINAVDGSVSKSPDQASYSYGTTVTLTATPRTGYHFVNWVDEVRAVNINLTVLVNETKGKTTTTTPQVLSTSFNLRGKAAFSTSNPW